MAFHYSRRKLKAREAEETGELNIVPYLDILMNLIMFMLLSITGLTTFGVLNVTAPSYGASASVSPDDNKPKLLLTVLISKKGFYVAGAGGVLGQGSDAASTNGAPTIPAKADGTYDYATLTSKMLEVKKQFPTETSVIVGAETDVQYETLVGTMDAIREAPGGHGQVLFPDVTLAAM